MKVLICTSCYDGMCTVGYTSSMINLFKQATKHNLEIEFMYGLNEALITYARNMCDSIFLKSDATHLLFIDSDIQFDAEQVIRMILTNKDFVCGIYPKKETGLEKELLIGCGSRRKKILHFPEHKEWSGLVTLDINEDHKPDIVHDLCVLPYPFEDNEFDEIHAYDVLEHTGAQGDYKFFFAQWSEFWRILKPNGCLFAKCPAPNSRWAWGDPSHTRIVSADSLVFLKQPEYTKQVGVSAMSDFRHIYKADFEDKYVKVDQDDTLFVMQAIKPSRYYK